MQKRGFEENAHTIRTLHETNRLSVYDASQGISRQSRYLPPTSLNLMTPSLANLLSFRRPVYVDVSALLEQQQRAIHLNDVLAAQQSLFRQSQENMIAYHQHNSLLTQPSNSSLEQALYQRHGLDQILSSSQGFHEMLLARSTRRMSEFRRSDAVQPAICFDNEAQAETEKVVQAVPSGNSSSRISSCEGSAGDEDQASIQSGDAPEKFPLKLYRMLEEAEINGDDSIVSFLPHGKAFIIHKQEEFVSKIMPKYFSATRMASFQRQLNLYGFRRITAGNDQGGYSHDLFIRGRKGLCKKIRRKRATTKAPPTVIRVPRARKNEATLHDVVYPPLSLDPPESGIQ